MELIILTLPILAYWLYKDVKKLNRYMKNDGVIILLFIPLLCPAQTTEQVRKELIRQNVPHHAIVLAQARLETGNFTSRQCKVNKNLFGIKHKGRYARYGHWKESVKDYQKRISSRYDGGSYYQFLKRIGYAEDAAYIRKLKHIIKTSKK